MPEVVLEQAAAGSSVLVVEVLFIMLRVRPDVIISTGAAIGYFAFKTGKLMGAKTVWIDSIANVEQMSMGGMPAQGAAAGASGPPQDALAPGTVNQENQAQAAAFKQAHQNQSPQTRQLVAAMKA